ncbi:small GTP-binding protein [Histomonas meleagridis]|uniref:small GTP-binding protein n=1 Tax=Histomonas meleagridis TaxID=135588 RepID=UPI003559CE72|nr:small GTP-binding protein [Histomonas meleagridis]KAH0797419.1 small GTP-binding protein [Histomonas meleagridis]
MSSTKYRVVLIGNSFVGKTALANRHTKKEKPVNYSETVGSAFVEYTEKIDNEQVSIQLWDTAGQDKYRSLCPVYFRNVNAAILVYDVTDQASFDALQYWMNFFHETAGAEVPVFIVGNKIDLEDDIVVDVPMGQKFAQEHGCLFFSTSAETGLNVEFLFQKVAETVYHNTDQSVQKKNVIQETEPGSSSGCC